MFQNQLEYGTSLNWVKGRHTLSFGAQIDQAQLNVLNHNTNTDTIAFTTFLNVRGRQRDAPGSKFGGVRADRLRAITAPTPPGLYVNDNWKVRSNLTVTAGLRWDYEGPLTEKYGRLTGFNPSLYAYNAATDTITNSGLEIASNNAQYGTAGRRQLTVEAASVWFRAAPGHRLFGDAEADDSDGIRDVLRSRRTVQRVFAQRGRRL